MAYKANDSFEHQCFPRLLFGNLIKAHIYYRESISEPGKYEVNPETTRFELNPDNNYQNYEHLITLLKQRNKPPMMGIGANLNACKN